MQVSASSMRRLTASWLTSKCLSRRHLQRECSSTGPTLVSLLLFFPCYARAKLTVDAVQPACPGLPTRREPAIQRPRPCARWRTLAPAQRDRGVGSFRGKRPGELAGRPGDRHSLCRGRGGTSASSCSGSTCCRQGQSLCGHQSCPAMLPHRQKSLLWQPARSQDRTGSHLCVACVPPHHSRNVSIWRFLAKIPRPLWQPALCKMYFCRSLANRKPKASSLRPDRARPSRPMNHYCLHSSVWL